MDAEAEIVDGIRVLFGDRLRGVFAFGSRLAGSARPQSDLDLAVWIEPPVRRATSWIPWVARFGDHEPPLDPTFFTDRSLVAPPGWLLEATCSGARVLYDPTGALAAALAALRDAVAQGRYRRRLFMGLPYYEEAKE